MDFFQAGGELGKANASPFAYGASNLMDQFDKQNEMKAKLAGTLGMQMALKKYENELPVKQPPLNELQRSQIELNKAKTLQASSLQGTGNLGFNATGEDFIKQLNPQEQNIVKGLTDYKLDPARTFGLRNDLRARYISYAQQYDPTFDMSQFPSRQKIRSDYTTGKNAKQILGFNTAIKHLGTLDDAIGKTPDSPYTPFNKLQRAAYSRFSSGSPESLGITEEETALNAVAGELANIFKQTGATDPEIKSWVESYNRDASRANRKQYIKTGVILLESRLNSLQDLYERGMGKPYPGTLVDQSSRETIGRLFGASVTSNQQNLLPIEEARQAIARKIAKYPAKKDLYVAKFKQLYKEDL